MKIPKTIEVICKAWNTAEKKLVEEVSKYSPGRGEECITDCFFVLLQKELEDASEKELVKTAFIEDLMEEYPDIPAKRIENFSQGLIAEALHSRYIEGSKTGGDFGLIISSPEVERSADRLHFSKIQNGLLCQAKLKRKKKWEELTETQEEILPKHLKYLAITLYRYEDAKFRRLRLGQWFSCKRSSVDKINNYLKNDFRRARLKNSSDVLKALAEQKLGTQDAEIIKDVIAPGGSRRFELRIWWKDKDEYFSEVINSAIREEVKISVERS